MWYIWKNRNDKIYTNKNGNPQEILRQAEVEGTLWVEAQLLVQEHHGYSQLDVNWQTMGSPRVWGMEGTRYFHRTGLVLQKNRIIGHNDGGNESSTKPITFAC